MSGWARWWLWEILGVREVLREVAGNLGEGAAISTAMIPFLLFAIMVSWFGLQRRKWQQGGSDE